MRVYVGLSLAVVLVSGIGAAQPKPYITTQSAVTLVSVNDGENLKTLGKGQTTDVAADSITVIRLSPDKPPAATTVYGTVDSTIIGAPYLGITMDGRYAIIPHHSDRFSEFDLSTSSTHSEPLENKVTIVDLASETLSAESLPLSGKPISAFPHPDGRRIIVGGGDWMHIIEIKGAKPVLVNSSRVPVHVSSFSLSPDGGKVFATGAEMTAIQNRPLFERPYGVHLMTITDRMVEYDGRIKVVAPARFSGPFAPRTTADGLRVLVPNGFGFDSKGTLDGVVVIDTNDDEPVANSIVEQLGDGLESLAIHPNGKMAVVSCLDGWHQDNLGAVNSHLAVLDISEGRNRLLYHLPIEHVPEGIEFTPEGDKLFVGCTAANHIAVFEVSGFELKRLPAVLATGHGPSLMGLSRTWIPESNN